MQKDRSLGPIVLALASAFLVGLVPGSSAVAAESDTATVSIDGATFLVNGAPTYDGTAIEGLLMNARMINAAFDDENASTRDNWNYPDTGVWDPDRNTNEFVSAVPTYAQHGLRAITVGLQGGRPMQDETQNWDVSAFRGDGSIKADWLGRLDRVIRASEASGIVVILSLFYKAQDHHLDDEAAVKHAVDATTDWILDGGYSNVLVEVGNETNDVGWDHSILSEKRITELIGRVQSRSEGRLLVSTSFGGGYIPPDGVIRQSDFVLVHGNSQSATGIRSMVDKIRSKSSYSADPKPIVFNEDSTTLANLDAAVERGASWGYHDRGANNYVDGFQSVPINWTINTAAKKTFFDRVEELSGSSGGPVGPPAEEEGVLVSSSPDRSSPGSLSGAHLSGSVYVFAADGPDIAEVRFYLDDPDAGGTPHRVERSTPFDFAGTAGDGRARPFDTTSIADGSHTITATVVYDDGSRDGLSSTFTIGNDGGGGQEPLTLAWRPDRVDVEIEEGGQVWQAVELGTSDGTASYSTTDDGAWLTVSPASGSAPATLTLSFDSTGLEPGTYTASVSANADGYASDVLAVTFTVKPKPISEPVPSAGEMLFSRVADRSSPTPLAGATTGGPIYVFVEPPGTVERVRFYLDDPGMKGAPRRLEHGAPWDFAGSNSKGVPRPLDTRQLTNGDHVITAAVDRPDGTIDVASATFAVRND